MRHYRAGTLPPKPAKPPCRICGEPSKYKGLCQLCYSRMKRGADPTVTPERSLPDEERFWVKVDKASSPDGCWLWGGTLQGAGYGMIYWKGYQVLAHRLAYELVIGPIPEHHQIDHVWDRGCRNRHCVNPSHLEPVSLAENVRRAQIGKRKHNGRRQQELAKLRLTGRFWARVQTGELAECWPWLGYVDPEGAARFWREGSSIRAQRVAYELGGLQVPDPKKMTVQGTCDTPNCMNPTHLAAIPRALSRGNIRPGRREERVSAGKKGMDNRWHSGDATSH